MERGDACLSFTKAHPRTWHVAQAAGGRRKLAFLRTDLFIGALLVSCEGLQASEDPMPH